VSTLTLAVLTLASGIAAAVGAITGGNSLLTVPIMLLAGMDPAVAVATNMVASLALTISATARFLVARAVPRSPTLGLALLAVPGSIVGAELAVSLPRTVMRVIVAAGMLGIVLLLWRRPQFGATPGVPTPGRRAAGYLLSLVWGIYGGVFAGGYTTVLTLGAVALFGTSLKTSVALTKPVNLASCAAAVALFIWRDRIDWRVAIPMAAAALVGGWLGAHFAAGRDDRKLRRAFLWMVAGLAVAVVAAEMVTRLR
jgi:uncharacterized protein